MLDRRSFVRSLGAALTAPLVLAAQPPRPYNVLILGDSIAWGQGLEVGHRWRDILVDHLRAKLKRDVVPYAPDIHSGAIIGIGDQNQIGSVGLYQPGVAEPSFLNRGPYAGEVPSSTPTILKQLDTLAPGVPIDLVVISASINDVSIGRFINPYMNRDVVDRLIDLHCGEHLAALLDRVRTRCVEPNPGCRVIVLSYYRMISKDSTNFPSVYDFVTALLSTPPATAQERRARAAAQVQATVTQRAPQGRNVSSDQQPQLVKDMIAAAAHFFERSQLRIQGAVDFANRPPFARAFFHVTPKFAENQAIFVEPPNVAQGWDVSFPSPGRVDPIDEVAAKRIPLCTDVYKDKNDNAAQNACRIASIGHPNVDGANHGYFDAIWPQIDALLTP